jgi:hypothetical protein
MRACVYVQCVCARATCAVALARKPPAVPTPPQPTLAPVVDATPFVAVAAPVHRPGGAMHTTPSLPPVNGVNAAHTPVDASATRSTTVVQCVVHARDNVGRTPLHDACRSGVFVRVYGVV